jgi:hypothetical protein
VSTDIAKWLLAVAKVMQWVGILSGVAFVGGALFAIEMDRRVSDAIADSVPLFLAASVGCAIALAAAVAIRSLTRKPT